MTGHFRTLCPQIYSLLLTSVRRVRDVCDFLPLEQVIPLCISLHLSQKDEDTLVNFDGFSPNNVGKRFQGRWAPDLSDIAYPSRLHIPVGTSRGLR